MTKVLFLTAAAAFLLAGAVHRACAQSSVRSTHTVTAGEENHFLVRITPAVARLQPAEGIYSRIAMPGAARTLAAGAPDVPYLSYGVATSGSAGEEIAVTAEAYYDYHEVDLLPSKGNLPRTVDPATIPAIPGEAYARDEFYPKAVAAWGETYTMHGVAGRALHVYPVRYNPVRRILRVYSELALAVHTPAAYGAAAPAGGPWNRILQRRFINWNTTAAAALKTTGYVPASETGAMLIVTPARFLTALQPFRAWKAARGIRTYVVLTDTVTGGATPAKIKALVQARYAVLPLDYLLLVGDAADVPPVEDSALLAGPSDAAYAYLDGPDHYTDLLVGRFSANTVAELSTQVTRSIQYEKIPLGGPAAAAYTRGIGVASSEGPGDDGQMDYEHMRGLRTDLMAAGFTAVGEYYDGSQGAVDVPGDPAPSNIVSAVNGGASLLNYCGHGWTEGFGTSGFSTAEVPGLANSTGAWPFVFTVACVNGEFLSGTCLAEAMLRSTSGTGTPTGAVGFFSSTINQSWSPPMEAQDEATYLITAADTERVWSIGALAACGTGAMNDAYGLAGDEMTDTWVLFGDPSLQLRTRMPDSLIVTHAATLYDTAKSLTVITGTRWSTAVLMHADTLFSVLHATDSAGITAHSFVPLPAGDSLRVWVTGPDAKPYSGVVRILAKPVAGIATAGKLPAPHLFPNPASETLTLRGHQHCTYTLHDAAGRQVASGVLAGGTGSVSVASLPAGAYFLTLTEATAVYHLPVQVAR